jgi:hypothetical protein
MLCMQPTPMRFLREVTALSPHVWRLEVLASPFAKRGSEYLLIARVEEQDIVPLGFCAVDVRIVFVYYDGIVRSTGDISSICRCPEHSIRYDDA